MPPTIALSSVRASPAACHPQRQERNQGMRSWMACHQHCWRTEIGKILCQLYAFSTTCTSSSILSASSWRLTYQRIDFRFAIGCSKSRKRIYSIPVLVKPVPPPEPMRPDRLISDRRDFQPCQTHRARASASDSRDVQIVPDRLPEIDGVIWCWSSAQS